MRGILVMFLGLLALNACKKTESIGDSLQPEDIELNVKYTDTVQLVSYAVREDTVRTDRTAFNLLGSRLDPVFGSAVAGFALDFTPANYGFKFGNPDTTYLDSLVLQMEYRGYFGDTNDFLRLHAYELAEIMVDTNGAPYYSNYEFQTKSTDYLNYEFRPRPTDSLVVGSGDDAEKIRPAVRLNLSNISRELGERLLAMDSIPDSLNLFKDLFNGLYLTASAQTAEGGSILSFNPTQTPGNTINRLTLYYHTESRDSLSYFYFVTAANQRVNVFNHNNYSEAEDSLSMQIVANDTLLGQEKLYLQAMAGVKTKIRLPNLSKWPTDVTYAINEAKLYLPGNFQDTINNPPNQLALVQSKTDGSIGFIRDDFEGDSYFGGFYEEESNSYFFRITQHMQQFMNGNSIEDDDGLFLLIQGSSSIPNHFIFNGPEAAVDSSRRMRLEVVYTIIN